MTRMRDPIALRVAANVARLRKSYGWTGAQLAQKYREVSESASTMTLQRLSKLETGTTAHFYEDELYTLAKVFDVTIDTLFMPKEEQLTVSVEERLGRLEATVAQLQQSLEVHHNK